MSLKKLLKAPIKLFKKDVISFVIIRRYDLGLLEDKLRYISVKPTTSVSKLRQKVWHLLDLPDFCEEVIILKSDDDCVIPLTDLRKGNDPQHPFLLEVWLPGSQIQSNTGLHSKLLTIQNGEEHSQFDRTKIFNRDGTEDICPSNSSQSTLSNETIALNKLRIRDERAINHVLTDFNKSDLSCRMSSSSFFKLNSRKSRDNFTLILMKMQSDLSSLNNKLSSLENRITT
ncbi:unnamed protein product [Arctia plantaginis]|uniref:Uncharacterized protein n=1 Tax=Arctia plantaginis TaxID=874455 RepID=A0A8S1B097_ARCPL|nr:unnamed protein product [Arctia plantaginis]